jgi:hypothetical protein
MKRKGVKVAITTRAALQRIDRAARRDGNFLRTNRHVRPGQGADPWRYWIIDANINGIVDYFDDPETYGKALGVIAQWETVREER